MIKNYFSGSEIIHERLLEHSKPKRISEVTSYLRRINDLTLAWVSGHYGHRGNERVDKVANKGTNMNIVPQRKMHLKMYP